MEFGRKRVSVLIGNHRLIGVNDPNGDQAPGRRVWRRQVWDRDPVAAEQARDRAFFVINGGVVLVAEWVETSPAGRLVLDRADGDHGKILRPHRADKTPPTIAVEARERDAPQELME